MLCDYPSCFLQTLFEMRHVQSMNCCSMWSCNGKHHLVVLVFHRCVWVQKCIYFQRAENSYEDAWVRRACRLGIPPYHQNPLGNVNGEETKAHT